MEITKKLGKNRAGRKNPYKSLVVLPKYNKEIETVQRFRKELPEKLQGISLENKIDLLEDLIPQLKNKQMAIFARQLQDAYIAVWYSKKGGIKKRNSKI